MKNNNGSWLAFIILLLLTIGFIISGMQAVILRMNSVETVGSFSRSRSYTSKDEDFETTKYVWYYEYNVNGNTYEASVSGQGVASPINPQATILYNPSDPHEASLKNDHQGIIMLIAGVMTGLFLPIVFPRKDDSRNIESSENQSKRKEKIKFFIIWYGFLGLFYLVMCFSVDFNPAMLFGPLIPATLVLLLFAVLGIFMLKDDGNKVKYYSYNSTNRNNDGLNYGLSARKTNYDGLDNDLLKYNSIEDNNEDHSYSSYDSDDDNPIR
jgi:hypothetical protein